MTFKYGIISVDDSRLPQKQWIEEVMHPWERLEFQSVDGSDTEQRREAMQKHGLTLGTWLPKAGELGIWLSHLNVWEAIAAQESDVAIFEDDAIPTADFKDLFYKFYEELPPDWDFMALYIPDNQFGNYNFLIVHGGQIVIGDFFVQPGAQYISRAYQTYSCVATLYSPRGAGKLLSLCRERGLDTPIDCLLYEMVHFHKAFGFAPLPNQPRIVNYDWEKPSTINSPERSFLIREDFV